MCGFRGAGHILEACTPEGVSVGTSIIEQDASTNDLYLIVAGTFDIVVNGRIIARRFTGDHVGEMAAVQPTQRRSASVTAAEDAVIVKLTESQLSELAQAGCPTQACGWLEWGWRKVVQAVSSWAAWGAFGSVVAWMGGSLSPEILSSRLSFKTCHALHGVEGGHITPEWELWRNLRLLCGNHCGIKRLREKAVLCGCWMAT